MNDENKELLAKQRKLEDLKGGCERSYSELQGETGGRFTMDSMGAYVSNFIEHLIEWGVITELQKVDMELNFYGKVESTLNDAWEKVRKAKEEAKRSPKLTVPSKPTKLVGIDGKPLT